MRAERMREHGAQRVLVALVAAVGVDQHARVAMALEHHARVELEGLHAGARGRVARSKARCSWFDVRRVRVHDLDVVEVEADLLEGHVGEAP